MQAKQQFTVHSSSGHVLTIDVFDVLDYATVFTAMRDYSNERQDNDPDKIWLVQHPAVYTQGTACQQQTLMPSEIPVVKTDRGGQITFHGPGQVVMYPLINLRRFGIGVKALVEALEQSVIDTLATFDIIGQRREDAPGVYVENAKIASLGLRIRRGNSYHGLSFNFDMDLSPFGNIDPCGFQGLKVTQLVELLGADGMVKTQPTHDDIAKQIVSNFVARI